MMHTPSIAALLVVLMTTAFAEGEKPGDPARAGNGAYKWTVGATGDAGEVVVLRFSRTWSVGETKHVRTHDTVSYNPGKKSEGAFVATYDKAIQQWRIRPFGGAGRLDAEYSGSSFEGNSGTIKFTNKSGQSYEYRFSAFVMSYQRAVSIYDGLPSDSETGWKWAGEPKKVEQPEKGEQDGADQPATAPESKPKGKKKTKLESDFRPR